MKVNKPVKGKEKSSGDMTERLMRIIDVQSRVIEALAMAAGAMAIENGNGNGDDDEDKEDKDEEES